MTAYWPRTVMLEYLDKHAPDAASDLEEGVRTGMMTGTTFNIIYMSLGSMKYVNVPLVLVKMQDAWPVPLYLRRPTDQEFESTERVAVIATPEGPYLSTARLN